MVILMALMAHCLFVVFHWFNGSLGIEPVIGMIFTSWKCKIHFYPNGYAPIETRFRPEAKSTSEMGCRMYNKVFFVSFGWYDYIS